MTSRDRCYIYAIVGLILAIALASCKRSSDPAPTPRASAPFIGNVSGLGGTATTSQIDDLVAMERASFPEAQVRMFGPKNGWMADVAGTVKASKYDRLILLGHSFGGDTVARAAAQVNVDLLILIDPVVHSPGQDEITIPPSVKRCIVFRRASEGFWGSIGIERRANINGVASILTIDDDHNAIPHRPDVIAEVRREIQEALK